MLDLNDIAKYYSEKEFLNSRNIFREYLQYKILEILFTNTIKNKISFLGGTAIRIGYNSRRFSEDLDFDNFNLSYNEFIKTSENIKKALEFEGFNVEIRNIKKEAYHCHIKFPEILYQNNLTPLKSQKILIQIDTLSHGFEYKPEKLLLNKFDIVKHIYITPIDILLSQKLFAAFNRKRLKGRDFYDIIYLLGLTKPNFEYLEYKLDITNNIELKEYIVQKSKNVNFKLLAKDVEPFLSSTKDSEKILIFPDLVKKSF